MSQIITWTDEQLQSHFALWDKRTQQGEYEFMTRIEQFKYPWQGSGYSLECDGERVDLTLSQAQMVHEWLMSHVKDDVLPAKYDGTLGNRYTVAWSYNDIEIKDEGAEFVALSAQQALSLLAWLEQERARLEQVSNEQPTAERKPDWRSQTL